jgi:phosphate starvation-inducible PhoH-like protein
VTLTITLEHPAKNLALFGSADRHLRMIRDALAVQLTLRNDNLIVAGERAAVARAVAVINAMQKMLRKKDWLSPEDVAEAMSIATDTGDHSADGAIDVFVRGAQVRPKTPGQKKYIDAMYQHDLVLCNGPAGSGKTYLAVAVAVSLLKRGQAKRIVLARPAVEAGEKLGFLPGDLQQKVNPYLRPLFDALHDMMDMEQVKRFMANDVIEVVPLAFMRGRTLNESVVILDEAQNTTPGQMFMFLTRLGNDSKMIVTGDTTQVDLEEGTESGMLDAIDRLAKMKGIAIVELDRSDIVRHRLVQNIVDAYEETPKASHLKGLKRGRLK